SYGSWRLDGFIEQELFAASSPAWPGFPAERDAPTSFERALRLLLIGALALGPRSAAPASSAFGLAGMHGTLDVIATPAQREVVAELVDAYDGSTYRFVSRFDVGDAFPAQMRSERDGVLLALASRTAHAGGGAPLAIGGWSALDLPDVRPDAQRHAWTTVPPTQAGSDLVLPLEEAAALVALSPASLARGLTHPASYLAYARYDQRDVLLPAMGAVPGALPAREGLWSLVETDGGPDFRRVDARRLVPEHPHPAIADLLPRASIDSMREQVPPGPPPAAAVGVPPRAALPEELVSVELGAAVGRAALPMEPRDFTLVWSVAKSAALRATPDAARFTVVCHTPNLQVPLLHAHVSAVNGQLLSRTTLGPSAC
ncbi:MAG TPA: hypothetical protein VM582_01715, partial [Candidatus Thermoplasmatota archaeon]|nr:hypothetical protein [Candidatus Thermoplasmatota archaeon]